MNNENAGDKGKPEDLDWDSFEARLREKLGQDNSNESASVQAVNGVDFVKTLGRRMAIAMGLELTSFVYKTGSLTLAGAIEVETALNLISIGILLIRQEKGDEIADKMFAAIINDLQTDYKNTTEAFRKAKEKGEI